MESKKNIENGEEGTKFEELNEQGLIVEKKMKKKKNIKTIQDIMGKILLH